MKGNTGWENRVFKLRCWLRTRGNRYHIKGSKNRLLIKNCVLKSCVFDVVGENNSIVIGEGTVVKNVQFYLRGSGCHIEIGKDCYLGEGTRLHIEDSESVLRIGDRTTVGEALFAVTEPQSKMMVGSECMIAHDIEIRTGDSHSILDVETGERLNKARDVLIEDHVWIGAYAKILKGVTIQKGSIVALGAIVTKNIPENSIVAGNPAKLVKSGVSWCRERLIQEKN